MPAKRTEPDEAQPQGETYRCQFCGKESPAKDWKQKGQECPKCGRCYDWLMAQDSEE